jgi:hypothetical protein
MGGGERNENRMERDKREKERRGGRERNASFEGLGGWACCRRSPAERARAIDSKG